MTEKLENNFIGEVDKEYQNEIEHYLEIINLILEIINVERDDVTPAGL